MSDEVLQRIAALEAAVAELQAQRWTGEPRIGPRRESQQEIDARHDRMVETIKESVAAQFAAIGEEPEALAPALFTASRRSVFVARSKETGEFAREGQDTGMGRLIVSTPQLADAKFCGSPAGIMDWMGGHYRGYDALEVTITHELGEAKAFPPEPEVWPDAWRGSR